ncbi:AmmeMemoRadiSam system protein B [Marinobacterium iners]|nr:AmmeMemoRadiSam system protein B [Marinobacterium iners]
MMTAAIRPAAVAGMFYPASAPALSMLVDDLLERAKEPEQLPRQPRALVVPHAGLVYSGPIAALAYRLLQRELPRTQWRRVVLLGPNHRLPLRGMALPEEEGWHTPLGDTPLDVPFMQQLQQTFDLAMRSDVHLPEHSLEVQLPFLQRVAAGLKLVPILVGQAEADRVARLVQYLWQDPHTLVLISSDLSHYHSWQEARRLDEITTDMILAREPQLGSEQACGCHALNGLLLAARQEKLELRCLGQCTSGDTAGDKTQVVGYGAYVCF